MNNRYCIPAEATVRQALVQLNTLPGATMVLFVTDADGRLLGTVTDGDIRRALIRGTSLDSPVTEAAHTDFRYIRRGSRDVEAMKRCREAGITLLPVLDDEGRPVDIIDLTC
ncbi:MAG: CBS domain-containing protein, partial [Muribaculaceae bacterium]|nr:CBS domain-containing protein [Muribaculaceae bacterium]